MYQLLELLVACMSHTDTLLVLCFWFHQHVIRFLFLLSTLHHFPLSLFRVSLFLPYTFSFFTSLLLLFVYILVYIYIYIYIYISVHFPILFQQRSSTEKNISSDIDIPDVSVSPIQSPPRNHIHFQLNTVESLTSILILSLYIYIYVYPCFSSCLFSLWFTYLRICYAMTRLFSPSTI